MGELGGVIPAPATETIERYHTADLGAGSFYTPADEGLFSAVLESEDLRPSLQDAQPGWSRILEPVLGNDAVIGDGTNLNFYNTNVAARNIVIMRHHISTGTYERYNSQDLGAGVTYTPADGGLFSHTSNWAVVVHCEYKYNASWWYYGRDDGAGDVEGTFLAIGDGTNLRFHNTRGGNTYYVCMRAKIVS